MPVLKFTLWGAVKKNENGEWVKPDEGRFYDTREEAEEEKWSNEIIVPFLCESTVINVRYGLPV